MGSFREVCLLDLPRKALEIDIVGWNGDDVWESIDHGLKSYSTVISAASVVPPNDLPMLPARLVEQEVSSPARSTAPPSGDLSGHGRSTSGYSIGDCTQLFALVAMGTAFLALCVKRWPCRLGDMLKPSLV